MFSFTYKNRLNELDKASKVLTFHRAKSQLVFFSVVTKFDSLSEANSELPTAQGFNLPYW